MRILLWVALFCSIARAASLDVPYVHQRKQGCGAASVAMVMRYWENHGARAAPDSSLIYRALYRPGARGSTGGDMADYLKSHGFAAFTVEATWNELIDDVSRGRPPIVCIMPSKKGPLHYIVVIGVEGSKIVFHDPARGARVSMSFAPFQKEWRRTNNWVLIAAPVASKLKIAQ